jgi:hypothetical protein
MLSSRSVWGRRECRARICKRLRSPGIDSEESIPPAYVAWRAAMTNRVVVPARQVGNRFLGFFKGLQIRALVVGKPWSLSCFPTSPQNFIYFQFFLKVMWLLADVIKATLSLMSLPSFSYYAWPFSLYSKATAHNHNHVNTARQLQSKDTPDHFTFAPQCNPQANLLYVNCTLISTNPCEIIKSKYRHWPSNI